MKSCAPVIGMNFDVALVVLLERLTDDGDISQVRGPFYYIVSFYEIIQYLLITVSILLAYLPEASSSICKA